MALKFEVRHFVEETHPAYTDREGDSPYRLKITSLPIYGTLVKSGVPVSDNAVLMITEANKLEYLRDENKKEAHTDNFKFQIADTGSNRFSNIGTITINTTKIQSPPTVEGNSAILADKNYTFETTSFIKNFADVDGDSYSIVTIKSLPSIPSLKFRGGVVNIGLTFSVEDSDELTYSLPPNYAIYDDVIYEFDKDITTLIFEAESAGYKLSSNVEGTLTFAKVGREYETISVRGTPIDSDALCFDFTTSDNSTEQLASNVSEFCLIPQGSINVTEPYINKPPTIEDSSFEIVHGGTINFTTSNFLDSYVDPEDNAPTFLRIDVLPTDGTLFFNGVEVVEGQEISIEDIDKITFKPNITNEDAHTVSFGYSIQDEGSKKYSNIATVTVVVGEKLQNLPTVDDNTGILNSKIFTFSVGSFTKNFTDLDGDTYYEVYITTLPVVPELRYLGEEVSVGDSFLVNNSSGLKFNLADNYAIYNGILYEFDKTISEIVSDYNNLGYKITENEAGRITFTNLDTPTDTVTIQGIVVPNTSLQFTFRVTDDSEFNSQSNTATFSLIPQGNVNVAPIYTNTPPIVGDNTITLRYNEVRDFEQSDFVEDTDPEYYDPENDEPYELKVLTLPEYGQLLFNSSPVIVNQIISFIDIREGRFKYAADSSRTDIEGTSFLFAVSDIGSKQFTE